MKGSSVVVYCPAYNVTDSIEELVERTAALENIERLIVVDDGSTDSTTPELIRLSKEYPFIELISYTKNKGATIAVLDGMKAAIDYCEKKGFPPERTVVVRMDTDLEYQPEDIPKIVRLIEEGKTRCAAAQVPYGLEQGLPDLLFNRFAGWQEGLAALGKPMKQFCPGMNAIRLDLMKKVYPKLLELSSEFEKQFGKPMVTLDLITLAICKKLGEEPILVGVSKVEKRWVRPRPLSKIVKYIDYHFITLKFLRRVGLINK